MSKDQKNFGPQARDAPMARVIADAKGAFDTKAGGQIASLVYDSLVDGSDSADSYRLVFETPHTSVKVEVSANDDRVQIEAEALPAVPTKSVLHFYDSDLSLVAPRERTRFTFGGISHGLVRLSFEGADDPVVYTEWFRV
jgi:hypothetical protein